MAFEASVSGAKLRQFLQLLAAATRMSEGLFVEPTSQSLTLRAVSDSKSVHFVAVIPSTFFDSFKCPPSNPTLNLQLVSRAVAASALRFCPTLTRLVLQYNAAASPDVLDLSLLCQNGCVKIFSLFIGEEMVSEKADVGTTDALMTFRAVAEPRVWTGLLGQFSSSTKSLCFQATEHRLTLMETDTVDSASSNAPVTTFRAVVSADPKTFQSFTMTVSGRDPHRHGGVDANARASTGQANVSYRHQGTVLPGKTFEIRPLRWMLLLCDALQLAVRFSTGGPGLPVHVEGLRRSSDGMCSFLSLLVAVVDSESPPLPVPAATISAARVAPSIASDGAARSASRRPRAPSQHATAMSVAPTGLSMDDVSTREPADIPAGAEQHGDAEPVAVRLEPSLIAAHTGAAAVEPFSTTSIPPTAALSAVPPSVAVEEDAATAVSSTPTGSDRKRAREEQQVVVVASSDAAGGVAATPAARSSSSSTVVPQSSAKRCTDETCAPNSWANSGNASGEIFAQFPLDFDALGSDDDEGADPCDDLALQQFIAARLATNRGSSGSSSTPSMVPQSAMAPAAVSTGTLGGITQLDQVDLASALLMIPGTP